jgi:hypothetical protein
MIKKCLICQNEFTKGIKQFCSRECYNKNYHHVEYVLKSRTVTKKCAQCDKEYISRRNRYCSKECQKKSAQKWHRTRVAVEIECVVCKGKFTAIHKRALYCSEVCRSKGNKQVVIKKKYKKCRKCGNEFETSPGKLYCSVACKPVINPIKEEVKLICRICGKDFYGHEHHVFCSATCRKTYKNRKKHNRPVKGKWCESCGFNNRAALQAHHINRAKGEDTMTLCANCHCIFHHSVIGVGKKAESLSRQEVLGQLHENQYPFHEGLGSIAKHIPFTSFDKSP